MVFRRCPSEWNPNWESPAPSGWCCGSSASFLACRQGNWHTSSGCTLARITGILHRLVARGLLERERDPGDSRRARLRLNPRAVILYSDCAGNSRKGGDPGADPGGRGECARRAKSLGGGRAEPQRVLTGARSKGWRARDTPDVLIPGAAQLKPVSLGAAFVQSWFRSTPAVEDAGARDDTLDALSGGSTDHRQDTAALRQTLEHHVDRMIGMRVHEGIRDDARTAARRPCPIACQLVELLARDDAPS